MSDTVTGGSGPNDFLDLQSSSAEGQGSGKDVVRFRGSTKHPLTNPIPYIYGWFCNSGLILNRTRVAVAKREVDEGPTELRVVADHAWAKAKTYDYGGTLRLAGGLGVRMIVVKDWKALNGAVFHFRVNSGVRKRVEGVHFQAETSNEKTAQNLAAAIGDVTGTGAPEVIGTVIYLAPHQHNFEFDIALVGNGATVVKAADGAVSIGNGGVGLFRRTGLTTDSVWNAFVVEAQKFGAPMKDGFGVAMTFDLRHVDGDGIKSSNTIGEVSARRTGADNSGTLSLKAVKGGKRVTGLEVTPDGKVKINFPGRGLLTLTVGSDGTVKAS